MSHYKRRVGPAAYSVVHVAAVIALICLSPRALHKHAQSQTLEARERELRSLRIRKERPREPRLDYQQVKEDVEHLQVMNRHLSEAVGAGGPALDYRQIRKNATEVRKRAARLKINLLPPEPEEGEKPKEGTDGFTTADLKSAVDALDALVKSFVGNPISQRPVVLDMEASAGARRDLEGIIRLSEEIRRRAGALGKAAGKSI